MDIQQYIYSGVLEQYCLGRLSEEEEAFVAQISMLYPNVEAEINRIELSFEYYDQDNTAIPGQCIKQQSTFDAVVPCFNKPAPDMDNLPEICPASDHKEWLQLLEHLIPEHITDDFNCRILKEYDGISQMLVVTRLDVVDERHDNTIERFLILKGRCECSIGTNKLTLTTGDFVEIPIHAVHNVKLLSPYLIAVLQHKAVT